MLESKSVDWTRAYGFDLKRDAWLWRIEGRWVRRCRRTRVAQSIRTSPIPDYVSLSWVLQRRAARFTVRPAYTKDGRGGQLGSGGICGRLHAGKEKRLTKRSSLSFTMPCISILVSGEPKDGSMGAAPRVKRCVVVDNIMESRTG